MENKTYTILSFTRDDLRHWDIPAVMIDSLTDDELESIATEMASICTDAGFQEMLEFCLKCFLVFRKPREEDRKTHGG